MMTMRVWPGKPYPLGATWDGSGVNFALFSENATGVQLCLFDSTTGRETCCINLREHTDQVWHGYLPDVEPGQWYGYRVKGKYKPEHGHRFNHHKVLFDPYAKAIGRDLIWDDSVYGYQYGHADNTFDTRDSASFAPLAAVVDTSFTWGDDRPPRTPWHQTLIYEAHVKGLTRKHPDVTESKRGTYAGVASEAMIKHYKRLGVTAIELLPVHHHINERRLVNMGLSNYWGYNTLAFFAPQLTYASRPDGQRAVNEFKQMVRTLHSNGIEVILDVVYNHTCEYNETGPTLSWRGIDNAAYYRLDDADKRKYIDFTGCGNTLQMMHPRSLQLIMDSLRYWVTEMHVDGFRFDLASTLARELHEVNRLGAFFDIIHQDPILSQVKLIAEPWDVGPGGYQVGNFPVLWTEWNGKYRDSVRRFWKGDGRLGGEIATRLAGSSDLYEMGGRKPYASVNFVTCHDGFNLQDLVSYNEKHNLANGEDNRDGSNDEHSWNHGAEGPTDDKHIIELRDRQKRNFIATLFFSQGVPMLLAGDELSHTRKGNNNVYCQDNDLTHLDWKLDERKAKFLDFVAECARIFREQPVLQRRKFFTGKAFRGSDTKDIAFYQPDGNEMSDHAWANPIMSIGLRLAGDRIDDIDPFGQPITGDTLLLLLNTDWQEIPFTLPPCKPGEAWQLVLTTTDHHQPLVGRPTAPTFPLYGRSLALLKLIKQTQSPTDTAIAEKQHLESELTHTLKQPTPPLP